MTLAEAVLERAGTAKAAGEATITVSEGEYAALTDHLKDKEQYESPSDLLRIPNSNEVIDRRPESLLVFGVRVERP